MASQEIESLAAALARLPGLGPRSARRAVLHHGTLMLRCPLAAIERYLPVPPDRPGVAHADFITGLSEEGYPADMQQLQAWLAAEFGRRLQSPDGSFPG